ncbi:MAG: 4-hydroxy-tetrahydrodipicolinate reductase [Ruminococcaceae bacterium]|nr:4-hydroxy-tetrahydrodipicolinate reductase [Oscillospiraceae bacterium]
MINVILCGCCGRMGRAITEAIAGGEKFRIVAGVDITPSAMNADFPVYHSISEFPDKADVIIDFSHHSVLPALLEYAISTATPIVVSTTGHSEEELAEMKAASEKIPVFFSRNMSIGINLLIELSKKAAKTLGLDFDVEIIEKHHNNKLDAPSGTALMLAEAISEERDTTELVYDRHLKRAKRSSSEIGIHSVRGGTIVGEHEVIYAGNNEIISLSHTATSREVFATGALKAAEYLSKKKVGLFNMSDVINDN